MSHSVIYVLFKSSKKAAPGINIITVKDHLIYPVKEQNRERTRAHARTHTYIHTHTHKYTLKQNTMMPYLVLEKGIHHINDADCICKTISGKPLTPQAAVQRLSSYINL